MKPSVMIYGQSKLDLARLKLNDALQEQLFNKAETLAIASAIECLIDEKIERHFQDAPHEDNSDWD